MEDPRLLGQRLVRLGCGIVTEACRRLLQAVLKNVPIESLWGFVGVVDHEQRAKSFRRLRVSRPQLSSDGLSRLHGRVGCVVTDLGLAATFGLDVRPNDKPGIHQTGNATINTIGGHFIGLGSQRKFDHP